MGKATQLLRQMVKKQIEEHGIVVWYDPEGHYADALEEFDLPDIPVLRFEGSMLQLRAEAEPYLEFLDENGNPRSDCMVPPKFLVYMPRNRADTDFALAELECGGVVMEPGAAQPDCNTKLRIVAEQIFRSIRPDQVDEIGRKADEGVYTLEDLDNIAETGPVGIEILDKIFKTSNTDEIRLKWLASDEYDEEIDRKKARKELLRLFDADMGIGVGTDVDCAAARKAIARLLLMGDFVSRLHDSAVPASLQSVPVSTQALHRQKMQEIADVWRNRIDLKESYISHARRVDEEAGLAGMEFDPESLLEAHTFPSVENRLLWHTESLILDERVPDALEIAGKRKLGFWSVNAPPNDLRWALLESAARIMITGEDIRMAVKQSRDAGSVFESYTSAAGGWYRLDTLYRHLERQYAAFDLDLGGGHDQLEKVVVAARQAYTSAVEKEAEAFDPRLRDEKFRIEGVLKQTSVFGGKVAPLLGSGSKVAYLAVDALRYEMGTELAESLDGDFEVECSPVLVQLPSITPVGMAAILPNADGGMALTPKGQNSFNVEMAGRKIGSRPSRVKYLSDTVSQPVQDLKLNDLIKPSKKKRELIRQSSFLYVTSQEIDRLGEGGETEDEIRIYMDAVLEKLGKGIRRLASLGVEAIIVTADHGHLFAEPLGSGMKIEPPGGGTMELHRRAWIGKGGSEDAGHTLVSSGELGLGGPLEIAFPKGLGAFKARGGGTAYMHGGTSLQESVVPVITLHPVSIKPEELKEAQISIELSKPSITTRFFSMTLTYNTAGLFGPEKITVKVMVKSGRNEVGEVAAAAYGFEESTREIVLQKNKPNAVTAMITEVEDIDKLFVQVVDAGSLVELKRTENIPVEVKI